MSAPAQPPRPHSEAPAAPEAPRLAWAAEALQSQLAAWLPGLAVEVVASLGSTNTELLSRARDTGPDRARLPCLLVAERQTQGRGRQGKAWHADIGTSLTFSLALPLTPADWSGLSLAVGLALADAIDPPASAAPRIGLKWPNDLLLLDAAGGARKLGGILIETLPWNEPSAAASSVSKPAGTLPARLVVIGIGLNLQPPPDAPTLAWGAGGVQALHPGLDAPQLLALVAAPVLQAVQRFAHSGFAPLVAAYARRDVLHGRAVHTTLPQLPEGVADGVDAQGMLWLRHAGGRQAVGSGEVSLRLAQAAQPGPAPGPAANAGERTA